MYGLSLYHVFFLIKFFIKKKNNYLIYYYIWVLRGVAGGGDMSPPIFGVGGTNYHLSPPIFESYITLGDPKVLKF